MVRLKYGVFCVLVEHCLEGIPGDYLVLSPEVSWLEPAGIACVWRRAVPASLHKGSVQFPLGITTRHLYSVQ